MISPQPSFCTTFPMGPLDRVFAQENDIFITLSPTDDDWFSTIGNVPYVSIKNVRFPFADRKTKLCTIVSGKLGRHSVSRDATIIATRLVLPARDLLRLKLFSSLYDESRLPVERTISERCSKPLNFDDQYYLDACSRRDLNYASRW